MSDVQFLHDVFCLDTNQIYLRSNLEQVNSLATFHAGVAFLLYLSRVLAKTINARLETKAGECTL